MRKSHTLLLRLMHDPAFEFRDVRATYLDRGAPEDRTEISGEDISKLDPLFIEIDSGGGRITCIPYHRLRRIEYRGWVLWEYGSSAPTPGPTGTQE